MIAIHLLLAAAPPNPSVAVELKVAAVANDTAEASTTQIALLEKPPITSLRWMVRGMVRYTDVEGQGYLETWNVVGKDRFFSRTLSPRGPMAALSGSSDWRGFVLPFDATSGGQPPSRIELNVVLPGKGRVELKEVELVDMIHPEGGRISGAQAGFILGTLGALFGILAGLMGVLAGRGHSRSVVFGLWSVLMLSCVCAAAFGLAALIVGQPFYFCGGLLLYALLGIVILVVTKQSLQRRYAGS